MKNKFFALMVLVLFGLIVSYSFVSIKEKEKISTEALEKDIEEVLDTMEDKLMVYIEGYSSMMGELSQRSDMLYYEDVEYKGSSHLDAIQDLYPQLQHVYYATETGEMFLSPYSKLPDDYDPRERPWYKEALSSDKLIWTQPYLDASNNKLILSGALQILGDTDLNGVLGWDVEIDTNIFSINKDLLVDYEIIILSELGTIIYQNSDNYIGVPSTEDAIIEGLQKTGSTFEYGLDRKAYIRTTDLDWYIILAINSNDL